uniref:Uncharacterized protein n=1 Tax=Candidatus Kentrum sp. SD TaxID=2126332 RepID=A0A451BRN3_9GAMM|nr:MAG: hypothetical protein BECKSD772F_GA0070984_106221 [Candidatus Kentron sp. SD]VFK46073.1 MAG: hypothetical protein BECKSD772E_GA0070983_106620 [Candidatus Kentron sp. SD]VFK80972.1 MAG: hypothetical protein BECKSD772D_GA0070982_11883 [Candidatus Kentron sp. SD]
MRAPTPTGLRKGSLGMTTQPLWRKKSAKSSQSRNINLESNKSQDKMPEAVHQSFVPGFPANLGDRCRARSNVESGPDRADIQ